MADDKKAKEPTHGLNTAGKVLGILSIVFAAIFISAPLGLLLGIIGLILAIIYKVKGGIRSAGLVLTIVGTAISIFMTALLVFTVGTVATILMKGLVGNWSCRTSDGDITTIDISTEGYRIDGELVDLDNLKVDNVDISSTNGLKEMTVVLKSDKVTYTCEKH